MSKLNNGPDYKELFHAAVRDFERLTKQRDELVAALHWIASQPTSGAIQCKALEALEKVKDKP
jgi:hypothetical protein